MATEAQKAAAKKWDRENMTTISVKVNKKFKAQFLEACEARNITAHAAMKQAIEDWMNK